jgi:hypothetical protein
MHSNWIVFAAVMLMIVGTLDVIWGIAAIANDEVVIVGGHGVMILDITTWGWIQLILGLLIALVGVGLFLGNTAARWVGVGLISLNVLLQVVWFSAAPLWALLIIALDIFVIYQICTNWTEEVAR